MKRLFDLSLCLTRKPNQCGWICWKQGGKISQTVLSPTAFVRLPFSSPPTSLAALRQQSDGINLILVIFCEDILSISAPNLTLLVFNLENSVLTGQSSVAPIFSSDGLPSDQLETFPSPYCSTRSGKFSADVRAGSTL